MPAEAASIAFPEAALKSFVLVLARVSGAVTFVPMPGFRAAPAVPKILLVLTLSLALMPVWPPASGAAGEAGSPVWLPFWLLGEIAFGVMVGVIMAWLIEAFVVAMQVLGLQAGYAYASMIDPTTQADSSTLQVVAQLAAALVFVVLGLDREVLRAFAASLEAYPPGSFQPDRALAESVVRFGGSMLALAVRLALPLVSLLILVDVALALLGRINAGLQLLTLAFPVKMLISMLVLASLMRLVPSLFERAAGDGLRLIWAVLGRAP